jgi:adenosylcobinamide kinase / adenosylcobinamide-phosphate guanylyltransferase
MGTTGLMHVTLLGTGSADGWPNPFCTCTSCDDARVRGVVRGQTAALIDGRVLLDCGPETPRAAARLGLSLADVRVLVITHTHPDHLGPAALLFRRWAQRREPLVVIGPRAVIDVCRDWVGPDDPVTLRAVAAGDVVDVAGYRVTAVAAAHDEAELGPALVYSLRDADGVSMLYLTDTGPLPRASVDALAGGGAQLALVEAPFGDVVDHGTDPLDLPSFGELIRVLRDRGALAAAARVVAVHLSHHNPPLPQLSQRLDVLGADVVPDGAEIDVTMHGARLASHTAVPRTRPHRTLLLGGARSGKSAYAERLTAESEQVTYVATCPRPTHEHPDRELSARIEAHQRRRPSSWTTVETIDVSDVLRKAAPDDVVVIDCFTLWLSAQLDVDGWSVDGEWQGSPDALAARIDDLVQAWTDCPARVIGVSNEVGSGVVPANASGRWFRDQQGRLNAALARVSDDVRLVVAGRALPLPESTPVPTSAPEVR